MQPATLFQYLFTPWKKYNEFFDKGCKNIWGLAPIIKFTYIYFGLVIPYFVVSTLIPLGIQEAIEAIFTVGTFLILGIWALYMPILVVITFFRAINKTQNNIRNIAKSLEPPKRKLLNAYLMDVLTTISSISNVFMKMWLARKPDKRTASQFDLILWVLKFRIASLYFRLTNLYFDFLTWLTQFHPFSLIFTDRIFHAQNQKLNIFVTTIEGIGRRAGLALVASGGEISGSTFDISAGLVKSRTKSNLNKLEKLLQKQFGTVYVRKGDQAKLVRIIFPVEIIESL